MWAKIVKRWLIFVTVLSLIAVAAFFTQRYQVGRLAKSKVEEADNALHEHNFAKAEKLYWEHLVLFQDDLDVKIKYADTLLKVASSPKRQAEALQIYHEILTRSSGRDDVRRKQVELKFAMGGPRMMGAEDLTILLSRSENENDGELLFLMGRYCEENSDEENAEKWYQKAIKHKVRQANRSISATRGLTSWSA